MVKIWGKIRTPTYCKFLLLQSTLWATMLRTNLNELGNLLTMLRTNLNEDPYWLFIFSSRNVYLKGWSFFFICTWPIKTHKLSHRSEKYIRSELKKWKQILIDNVYRYGAYIKHKISLYSSSSGILLNILEVGQKLWKGIFF